jgi:PKD repeat protein
VQAGTQRSVTYNNLAPGTYTFHVIAANSDGVWNKTGDSITIIIDSLVGLAIIPLSVWRRVIRLHQLSFA